MPSGTSEEKTVEDSLRMPSFGMGAARDKQHRRDRELACQLVALGVLLAAGKSVLETRERGDFLDGGVRGMFEVLRDRLGASEWSEQGLQLASDWLRKQLGVVLAPNEAIKEAVLRTLRENAQREQLAGKVRTLKLQAENYTIPDTAFIKQVRELLGEQQ